MSDSQLNALCGKGFVTIARLRRLRRQAGLIIATSLPPEAAALPLHAGIPDARSLALCSPQTLVTRVSRLQRQLLREGCRPPTLSQAREWTKAAKANTCRSQSRPLN